MSLSSCPHIIPMFCTQKVLHKGTLSSCFRASTPLPGSLCWGWIHPREQKGRAELARPTAFTSRGWHRARATGSSGTHAGPLSLSRSAPGRTPSASPCDGTSACGESNSHVSPSIPEVVTVGQKAVLAKEGSLHKPAGGGCSFSWVRGPLRLSVQD